MAKITGIWSDIITDDALEQVLYREENIPILEKKILENLFLLTVLPKSQKTEYVPDSELIPQYKREIQPTLEEILGKQVPMPVVKFYSPEDKVDFSVIKLLPLSNIGFLGTLVASTAGLAAWAVLCYGSGFYAGAGILGAESAVCGNIFAHYLCNRGIIVPDTATYYDASTHVAIPPPNSKENVKWTLIHEHVHHHQNLEDWPDSQLLGEGHAMSITKQCAMRLPTQFLPLFDHVYVEFGYLSAQYRYLCKKHGVTPSQLFEIKLDNDLCHELQTDPHGKGISLFRIAEHHFGQELYKAMKRKEFDILLEMPK